MSREKFYLTTTLAICFVAAIFFVILIYIPMQAAISSMQLETRRLHAVVDNLDEIKKRHGDIKNFVALTEKILYETQEFLPAESSQDFFVAELYKIAEKNNILINSVQIGELETVDENEEDKKIFRQNIRLDVAADYISALNFLREILDGNRLVVLENLSLNSGENILTGEIELLIFSLSASS